jgi:propionyl-CoA carboxylase alpha chain/3-methylcrotonyl-CoA carboxylase alpha subunit
MIAKLIVHAHTREEAAKALADACASVEVWPVRTNAGFLVRCLEHPRFVEGDVDTGFIAAEETTLLAPVSPESDLAAAAALMSSVAIDSDRPFWRREHLDAWTPTPDALFGFRLNRSAGTRVRTYSPNGASDFVFSSQADWSWTITSGQGDAVVVDVELGRRNQPTIVSLDGQKLASIIRTDDGVVAFRDGYATPVSLKRPASTVSGTTSDGALRAPMPGKIVATPAKAGDTVNKGQPVVVLEAMKMEHALVAPFDGVVGEISVSVGDQVAADTVLAVVKAADAG